MIGLSLLDALIVQADKALRVLSGVAQAARPDPSRHVPETPMDVPARRRSAGLMRVNHVGEVCAQALYQSQAMFARNDMLRGKYVAAGRDEEDHLAWAGQRLRQLDGRPSLLNPLWYAGAYALGAGAALAGDRVSLGFVVETERQVEAHLTSHLDMLPSADGKSRAIVEQMRADEAEHGNAAKALGAAELPLPVRAAMQAAAKVMTTVAYYL